MCPAVSLSLTVWSHFGVLDWIDQTGVQVNILDMTQQQQDPLCGSFGEHSVLAVKLQSSNKLVLSN